MNDDTTARDAVTPLIAHSDALAAIVDRVGAATVAVRGRRHGAVSGVVWDDGLVVTVAHVFRRTPAAVTLVGAAGAVVEATLVGMDSSTDIALFRIAGEHTLLPAGIGDAGAVRAGHVAIAVGRSGEGDILASAGIVNRVGGAWQTWLGGTVDQLLRLDGGLDDGLSGAPVADARGDVIGIATTALSRSHGIVVPAATVTRVVESLLANGHVARPWLGIGAQPVPLPTPANDDTGLLVSSLAPRGPAERAGMLIGDIVVRAEGERAGDLRKLRRTLSSHVGKTATLSILRGGAPRELQVDVGEWPTERRCS